MHFRSQLTLLLMPVMLLAKGNIHSDSFESPLLQQSWSFHVYLPENYVENSPTPYPVIFLLHGSGGDTDDWDRGMTVLDTLIAAGKLAPLVAIAPASGTSWWVDGELPWETAFVEELIPYAQTHYAIATEPTARLLAGFSMGGYGALRYALAYPDQFGGAILLSPAIYAEHPPAGSSARSSGAFGDPFDAQLWDTRNYPALLPDYYAAGGRAPIFIAAGDDDWNHEEGRGFNVEVQAVRLYSTLNKQYGLPAELRIVNGGHNYALWLPMFREALETLTVFLPALSPKE